MTQGSKLYYLSFSWFAVTQLYVNNINFNVSMNVFAPLSPVPSSSIIPSYGGYEPPQIEVRTK